MILTQTDSTVLLVKQILLVTTELSFSSFPSFSPHLSVSPYLLMVPTRSHCHKVQETCIGHGHHCSWCSGFLMEPEGHWVLWNFQTATAKLCPAREWGSLSTLAGLYLSPWLSLLCLLRITASRRIQHLGSGSGRKNWRTVTALYLEPLFLWPLRFHFLKLDRNYHACLNLSVCLTVCLSFLRKGFLLGGPHNFM